MIRIIRKSEGKEDAAKKLMARFKLDEEQVDAILELKLYKLARLEILVIQKELKEKRAEAKRIDRACSRSDKARWGVVKDELSRIGKALRRQAAHARSAARSRRPSTTKRPSSSTRTPTWCSPATAGSSACASSRTPARPACARATR